MKANSSSKFIYPLLLQNNTHEVHFFFTYAISCWIGVERGAIWGFVAPMLVVIAVSRLQAATRAFSFKMYSYARSNIDQSISNERFNAVHARQVIVSI